MEAPHSGIRITHDQLSQEALQRVIEECVTRDGTEFTDAETKTNQVLRLLERGEVELWYDPASRTCNILPRGAGQEREET